MLDGWSLMTHLQAIVIVSVTGPLHLVYQQMTNVLEMVGLQAIIETLHGLPTSDPFDKIPLRVNV